MSGLAETLLSTLSNYGLSQLQHLPTYRDHVLDLFCSNKPGLIKSVSVIPGVSDHGFVVVDTVLKPLLSKKTPRKILRWSRADWASIKQSTVDFTKNTIQSGLGVEELYTSFMDHVKSLERFIPATWSRVRTDVPWLTTDLKRQCNKKHRLYNRARKTHKPSHWASYHELAQATKKALRSAHWRHVNKILDSAELERNSKPFWKYIRSQRQDSSGVAALKHNGKLHSDAPSNASILQKQFLSVFTQDSNCPNKDRKMDGPKYPSIPPLHVKNTGVQKLLSNINPSKASGPDEIAGRLLKELASELSPFLTHLFNKSLSSGEVPSVWRGQWVNPIFKKGSKCDAGNYRPVSLTCITSKIMEHIICSHVRDHLDSHSILSPFQHGFRSKHSCETQLLLTVHDIASIHDNNIQVDIGILDFSKAFDVVPHQRLLNKLDHYGINGSIHTWIGSFLGGRSQKVVVDGHKSKPAPVASGVPQGTVLGPLLFLLFINDMPSEVTQGTRIRLFADDCLIYRPIHCLKDQLTLQRDIDRLMDWADHWGMRFNAAKCNVMRTLGGIHSERFYHMKGQILQEVTHAKNLGVTLSRDHSWRQHIEAVVSKASQNLGFIRRNLRGAPTRSKITAYFTLVRAGLEYAAPVWDPYLRKDIDSIERIQWQAARWVKSQYSYTTSVTSLLKDLRWTPLADRRTNQKLCLLHKIHTGSVNLKLEDFGVSYARRSTRAGSLFTEEGEVISYKLERPRANKTPLQKSTIISSIPHWNRLPGAILAKSTTSTFRGALETRP